MILSEFIGFLNQVEEVKFRLQSGIEVPLHFHITELGMVNKTYIDCGETLRDDLFVSFQLWYANDTEHRLAPKGALSIINKAAQSIRLQDAEIEVEYQSDTIGKYALSFESGMFVLLSKQTNCLAEDQCGIIPQNDRVNTDSQDNKGSSACAPGSGCC